MDAVDGALELLLFAVCDAETPPTEDEIANALLGIIQLKKWKDEHERRRLSRNGTRHAARLD